MENRAFKVFKIDNGTVIDHIPATMAIKVIQILGHEQEGLIAIGMNLESSKLGKKDLIKYENKFLEKSDTDKLALIAPGATINIIENSRVTEKRLINLPDELDDVIECSNPNCITTVEKIKTKFILTDRETHKYRCHYCERVFQISPEMIK